ncbi:MAG: diadenylate cyclase CdaA [Eubacteriales bacterium]
MQEFLLNIISGIRIVDVIDVALVAFVVYKLLGFIHETRAEQLVKGILILVLATFLSDKLNLYTLNWILVNTMTLGVIALLIVFQPELRRALEYIGRSKFISTQFMKIDKEEAKSITAAIVKSIDAFSLSKTGALLVIERETALNEIAETGIKLDAEITTELLGNIFYEGSPLHDGAAIIRGNRLHSAGCVLPLTSNKDLGKELGTRHRAGIGITEYSDAVVLIVSEETGIISMAIDGNLTRFLDIKTVEKLILNIYLADSDENKSRVPFLDLFRGIKNGKK